MTSETKRAFSIGLAIVVIIFTCPIAIADLVYGYKDDSCLNEYPEEIHLNIKKYLIVSGLLTLLSCIYIIGNIFYLTEEPSIGRMVLHIIIALTLQTFSMIWNILGAIIFWNFIYPEGNCSSDVSNYLFATLVIKLVFTYMNFLNTINNKDD